jgi:hypothetical protein
VPPGRGDRATLGAKGGLLDKDFWRQVRENEFQPPDGHSVLALTEELFGYLGDIDSELRDAAGYEIFAHWLEQGHYPPEYLRTYVLRLIANLQEGLGEIATDGVFLRSFSALCLAEIVHYDKAHPFLDRDEIHNILARALDYLESEQDPRGYVSGKGWAHARAHTADLFYVLAEHGHTGREEHARILDGIQAALIRPTDWIYIHGEDERLVRATLAVFTRQLFDQPDLRVWLLGFGSELTDWRGSFQEPARQAAFFNTKSFLRCLYEKISIQDALPAREALRQDISDTIQSMRQY